MTTAADTVQRFTLATDSTGCCEQQAIEPDVNGEYVRFADYEALRASLTASAERIKDLETTIAHMSREGHL